MHRPSPLVAEDALDELKTVVARFVAAAVQCMPVLQVHRNVESCPALPAALDFANLDSAWVRV